MLKLASLFLLFFTSLANAQVVTPPFAANPWASASVSRLVGNVSTGLAGNTISNAITGQAAVRLASGLSVNVPISLVTNTSLSALASSSARLVPYIGLGITAAMVANDLKPLGYQWCATGWCKKKYPDSLVQELQSWNMIGGPSNITDIKTFCNDHAKFRFGSNDGSYTTTGIFKPENGTCYFSIDRHDGIERIDVDSYYGQGSTSTGCVQISGTFYSAQSGGVCVAADQSTTTTTTEDAQTAISTYYTTNASKSPALLDSVQQDLKANPNVYTPDLDPVKTSDPVTLISSPVTAPATVVETTTITNPDGTTTQKVVTQNSTITPTQTGNTVGNTTITYNTDNRQVTTNTNTSTGAVTTEDTKKPVALPTTDTPKTEVTDPRTPQPTLETPPTGDEIIAPIIGLMPDLKSYVVPSQAGQCPKPTISLFGKTFTVDAQCTIAENSRTTLMAIMAVVYAIVAVFIVLGA